MASGDIFIGLMSGTSIDAIDAVLVEFSGSGLDVIGNYQHPIPLSLKQDIGRLCQPGEDSIDLLGQTDRAVGMAFAKACSILLDRCGVTPEAVTAIGSHGQTVRHRPGTAGAENHFTVQIGDPSTIAVLTEITTVADFRRKDMARGGQGAPLVPAFHHYLFHSVRFNRVIINIGGIANITWLPASGEVIGFDTGPGNRLMDIWVDQRLGRPFDQNGDWAGTGNVLPALMDRLLRHPFLRMTPPKSTGREDFNAQWLDNMLAESGCTSCRPEDIQATLASFTARTVVDSFDMLPSPVDEIFVCGGGASNRNLMALIEQASAGVPVLSTATLGLPPQLVESVAFAWLARQTLNRASGSLASVTGADRDCVLGGIYYP